MRLPFFGKGKNKSKNSNNSNSSNTSTDDSKPSSGNKANTSNTNEDNKSSVEEGSGRAYSGFARLRQSNLAWQVAFYVLLIGVVCQDYNYRVLAEKLSEQQWMIIHDKCGETEVKDFSAFQTGASDIQIKYVAWNMVYWIRGAGTANVTSNYKQALKFMTNKMKDDVYRELEKRRTELEKLNLYFTVDKDLIVRAMKNEDLPIEAQKAGMRAGRYDVYVKATFSALREGTKDLIGTKDYIYWVRLNPLPRPTMENPMGLLVDHMILLENTIPTKGKDSLTENLNLSKEEGK
jgi:hypothetical protein